MKESEEKVERSLPVDGCFFEDVFEDEAERMTVIFFAGAEVVAGGC